MSGVSEFREIRTAASAFTVDENVTTGRITIRGTPIVFNSWSHVMFDKRIGHFRELIRPESVDRTLKSAREVHAYWNHQSGDVLGNTLAGTLILRKTTANISMELYPTPEWLGTPQAAAVKRGDVRGMSFAFGVIEDGDEWSDRPDEDGVWHREITDMDFSEVSIVGKPAYPATTVSVSQRSMEAFQAMQEAGTNVNYLRMLHRTRLAR